MRFYPKDEIRMEAWIGAVLRNHFLFAAEYVYDDNGNSLRKKLDCIPLPNNHPYHKQLSGGFPKGLLVDCSELPNTDKGFVLEKNHIYTVHLIFVGSYLQHYIPIIEAFRSLFARGFGHPMTQLTLIDIFEVTDDNQREILYSEECNFLNKPSHPIRLADHDLSPDLTDKKTTITLHFLTPVNLIQSRTKMNGEISYQDKLNGFPSFYQFMRSVVYRLMTFNMLYGSEWANIYDKRAMEAELNTFLEAATETILLRADLTYKKLRSTPKKEQSSVYVMKGYKGKLTWTEVDTQFVPLLLFASNLGIGNDINFGLGTFNCQLT